MTVRRDADVVVVGLGVLGAATLWQLARDGVRAVGVERYEPGHARGSSHGRSRALRFLYGAADYLDLLPHALAGWRTLEEDTGARLYLPTGTLFFARPGNADLERTTEIAAAAGIELERLGGREVAKRFGGFAVTAGAEAVHLPAGGMLDADACVAALLREAGSAGARIVTGSPVRRIDPDGARPVVVLDDGALRAEHVVVVAGAWTSRLLPSLAPLIRVTRQAFFTFRPDRPDAVSPDRIPVWCDYDTLLYGFPDHGPGLKIAAGAPGPVVDPERVDRTIDPLEQDALGSFLADRFPMVGLELVEAGTCLYTLTPDGDFLLGSTGDGRVSVGIGLDHGFKFAPTIGRILADLATSGRSRHPIERFRLDRFGPS